MPADALRLSREGTNLQRSVMRYLLRFAVDPKIISLAGGLPASEHLPLAPLRECLDATLTRDGPKALQYSPMHVGLRSWIAEYMGSRGVACTPDEVFIPNGRAINPITGGNWEETGVQPDISVPEENALDTAYALALEAVIEGVQQPAFGPGKKLLEEAETALKGIK